MSREFFNRFSNITGEEAVELNRIARETCALEATSEANDD